MRIEAASRDVTDWAERIATIYGENVRLDEAMRDVLLGFLMEALNGAASSRPHDFSHWVDFANQGLDAFEDRFPEAEGCRMEAIASPKNLHVRCRR